MLSVCVQLMEGNSRSALHQGQLKCPQQVHIKKAASLNKQLT